MLMRGLQHYGFHEQARYLKQTTIELVENQGFHEYFAPTSGQGLGSGLFSWTASSFLEVALEEPDGG